MTDTICEFSDPTLEVILTENNFPVQVKQQLCAFSLEEVLAMPQKDLEDLIFKGPAMKLSAVMTRFLDQQNKEMEAILNGIQTGGVREDRKEGEPKPARGQEEEEVQIEGKPSEKVMKQQEEERAKKAKEDEKKAKENAKEDEKKAKEDEKKVKEDEKKAKEGLKKKAKEGLKKKAKEEKHRLEAEKKMEEEKKSMSPEDWKRLQEERAQEAAADAAKTAHETAMSEHEALQAAEVAAARAVEQAARAEQERKEQEARDEQAMMAAAETRRLLAVQERARLKALELQRQEAARNREEEKAREEKKRIEQEKQHEAAKKKLVEEALHYYDNSDVLPDIPLRQESEEHQEVQHQPKAKDKEHKEQQHNDKEHGAAPKPPQHIARVTSFGDNEDIALLVGKKKTPTAAIVEENTCYVNIPDRKAAEDLLHAFSKTQPGSRVVYLARPKAPKTVALSSYKLATKTYQHDLIYASPAGGYSRHQDKTGPGKAFSQIVEKILGDATPYCP